MPEDKNRIAYLGYSSNHPLCMCLTLCAPCRVWNIQTGQVVNTLLHHKDAVWSLKFTIKTLVTGSEVSGYKTYQLQFHFDSSCTDQLVHMSYRSCIWAMYTVVGEPWVMYTVVGEPWVIGNDVVKLVQLGRVFWFILLCILTDSFICSVLCIMPQHSFSQSVQFSNCHKIETCF